MKIVDKSNHYPILSKHILSLAFNSLIPVEREKIVDFLKEKINDLVEDKEGIRLSF